MFIYFCPSKSARPFTILEKQFFLTTLNDPKSWPVIWLETKNPLLSNWSVCLEKQQFIDNEYSKHITGLSVTEFYDGKSPKTLFSYENFTKVPKPLLGTYNIHQYRTYLILHECGHALGLGHKRTTIGPAPVMLQQTLGLKKLDKNVWPLKSEINLLIKTQLQKARDTLSYL